MWEWNYAKEPFDMKLLVIRLIKKIWLPVLAALLGAAVVGGGYFLVADVFGGPDTYEVTSTYYVEFATDPDTGNSYTYINSTSWNTWITTDYFVDNIWEAALESGLKPESYDVERQDLFGFLKADLPSDLRMPVSTVTTGNPELTRSLAQAVEKAFLTFAQDQKEIESIRVVDTEDVKVSDKDIRTLRACVLGAVLGAFFALTGLLLCLIADDGVYLPQIFVRRYGIPALGGTAGYGQELHLLQESLENIKYVFRDCKTVALTSVEEDTDLKAVEALLKSEASLPEFTCIPGLLQVPEAAERLREKDGVLLLAEAGVCNGKQIEKMLHQLKVQDCAVRGVLLTDVDEKLVKLYERTGYWGKNR